MKRGCATCIVNITTSCRVRYEVYLLKLVVTDYIFSIIGFICDSVAHLHGVLFVLLKYILKIYLLFLKFKFA